MKKLKKGFEASNEQIEVNIGGSTHLVANLLKSGIVNQTIVLVAVGEEWKEVNVLDLGGDNSDLNSFKFFIENHNLKLSDLGIESKTEKKDYELKQQDFEDLQKEFPAYDYIKIAILNSYMKTSNQTTGMYSIREILKMLTRDVKSIAEYIEEHKQTLAEVSEKPQLDESPEAIKFRNNRRQQLLNLGVVFKNNTDYQGHGFKITENSIANDTDEDWNALIERIAAAAAGTYPLQVGDDNQTAIPEIIDVPKNETAAPAIPAVPLEPVKKPVSIETIGNLTPDRISEFQILRQNQLEIVSNNPFVKITDAKTLDKAKKHAAALLKGSTSIDGTNGILTNFVKHANQFIKMGKGFLTPIAEITRKPYDAQKLEITTFENAEALRIQAENAAKLLKTKNRTDDLFAIPMTFNGTIYSIGTLFVLPSIIESATDEEFAKIIADGKAIKQAMDSTESEKDKIIRELQEKLALLTGLNNMSNTPDVLAPPAPVTQTVPVAAPAMHEHKSEPVLVSGAEITSAGITPVINLTPVEPPKGRFKASEVYTVPSEKNNVLNVFDLQHAEIIGADPILPAFIKCRAYFIEGSKQTALEIIKILNAPEGPVKKSVQIFELCETIKNQE